MFFAGEIELSGVEYVLPNDIKPWCKCCYGIEVGGTNPDGKNCIFLSERLSASYGVVGRFAEGFACEELE